MFCRHSNRCLELALASLIFSGCGAPKDSVAPNVDADTPVSSMADPQNDDVVVVALDELKKTQSIEPAADGNVRFATFNVALNRRNAGELVSELESDSPKAQQLAAIVQTVRPQVLLINELDFDAEKQSMELLHSNYFEKPQDVHGHPTKPISYPHRYSAEVNTGVPSGLDLDGDGRTGGATDCFGYGVFPGQYGMAVYSQFPIKSVRSFQNMLWKDIPDAALPMKEDGSSYYTEEALGVFRISSKSHWDVEVETPDGIVHFLVCHPTPPVFDGPEDRNGRRNHDEIRLFADYVAGGERASYVVDDDGRAGGLEPGSHFVIAGDLNADPSDGASYNSAIDQLLEHPAIRPVTPTSQGGIEMSQLQGGTNKTHVGDPGHDTGDFPDKNVGNLRADYVLPSLSLEFAGAGVFWPPSSDPNFDLVSASDHRLVWIDVKVPPE